MRDKPETLPFRRSIDDSMVVVDEGPIDLHGPVSETVITYRVMCRIDGGPWSWELVGADKQSVTVVGPKQAEGYLKWLRARAAKTEGGPRLEYCAIPILLVPQLKAPPPPGARAGTARGS